MNRFMSGVFFKYTLVVALLCGANPLWAQTPLWLDAPTAPLPSGNAVLSKGASSIGATALQLPVRRTMLVQTAAASVPESIDNEIVALASALSEGQAVAGEGPEAKALRIFNWVRNQIGYEHYHGLKKGASMAFIEGSGNDFDQCALLRDLLVAAGYPASSVKFFRIPQAID